MLVTSADGNYPVRMGDTAFSALVTLSLVLLCIVSWFAYRASFEDRHATLLWFWGSVTLALASAAFAVRPVFPQWTIVNVVAVNICLCVGLGLHVSGLIRLDSEDKRGRWYWLPTVLAPMMGFWSLLYPWGRTVQAAAVAAIFFTWIGRAFVWVLGHRWGERGRGLRRVLGFYALAVVATIAFGTRPLWEQLIPPNSAAFAIGITPATLFLLDLAFLGIGFGELLLIHDRSSMRYQREVEFKLRAMVDLEEYRKLQKTLVEKERDVALGRMVASVNHSLNSPLAALISSNAVLGQVIRENLPSMAVGFRTLTTQDWMFVERAARAMQPLTAERRRKRSAAFSQWLLAHDLPDEPDSLVDMGFDLRVELLDELTRTSRPAAVFRLLSVWADTLSAGAIIDQATRKASRLLIALREWFETGFAAEAAPTPLAEVLRARVNELRRSHPGLTVETAIESSRTVSPPSRPLERVFQAVLENAALAVGGVGLISVRAVDSATGVAVEIDDDGPGISAKKEPLLFEPFVGASADSQSLGVSLYFCKLFLSEWGGSIQYRREPGRTRFTIELPQS